jgi:pimeloyl-ACP methyl ester carboxylesterase
MEVLHLKAAVIVGGSSGGFVARRFAIDHPQCTLGLVLISSPFTLRDKPGVMDIWNSTISKLKDPIDPGFVREFTEITVAQSVPRAFLETLVKESLKVPARVWKATFQGLLEDDSLIELNKIRAPTLVVWGEKDTTVPRSDQEKFVAEIANSRLLVYPGAGHALYCEEPTHLASDVITFINDGDR